MSNSKTIAISCGEPAGIGPEIAVAAWKKLRGDIPLLWIGDPTHLPKNTPWQAVETGEEAAAVSNQAFPVSVIDFGTPRQPGTADANHAPKVIEAIEQSVERAVSGDCAALCTGPIHKAALQNGTEFPFPGHTEFLAYLAGGIEVVMMLVCPELRVVPVTIHIPISDVPSQLTAAGLTDALLITNRALKSDFGIEDPRLAVAGLNPHAGEDGKMGTEEIELITPVLNALRQEGLEIAGPVSSDTMFHPVARATYDAAICMYHDQALIPIKTLDFSGGVNVTLGLPFIRTSPDHGTAFDIAGKGKADPTSMITAIRLAAEMAEARA